VFKTEKDHPFYSDTAIKVWERAKKRLEKEEQEMIAANRRAYRQQQKKIKGKGGAEDGD
jgi:hypothetical protein